MFLGQKALKFQGIFRVMYKLFLVFKKWLLFSSVDLSIYPNIAIFQKSCWLFFSSSNLLFVFFLSVLVIYPVKKPNFWVRMEYLHIYQRDPLEKIRVWAVFNLCFSLSNGVYVLCFTILCFFIKYFKALRVIFNAFAVWVIFQLLQTRA